MSRNGNGKTEPEFTPGAVRVVEDLGMTVADVEQLGFRVVEHWSCVPAVSERDAYAISKRQALIRQQREDARRRRDAEREEQMREFAARSIPRGVPAQQPGMSAIEVMFAADPDEREPSVYVQLLEEQFAAGKGA